MPPAPIARIFAWAGAALFAGALALFGARYAGAFGLPVAGGSADAWRPVLDDLGLFTVFAFHHTLCARVGVKALVTRLVPAALERAVYVWIASSLFIAVLLLWQPVPGVLWTLDGPWRVVASLLQLSGVVLTLASARRLDVFELAGVRQLTPRAAAPPAAVISDGAYGVVRHPIYFAWLLLVWPTPAMTGTRLVFAGVSTLYLCVAIPFEERDLRRTFGQDYADYALRVRARLVPFIY
jgi:protein-S-isoprenylcysteine O-methyltransferase Ste14